MYSGLIPFSKYLKSEPLAYNPRKRIPNPYVTSEGIPILVCIEGKNFDLMLEVGLNIMGGLNKLISYNQDVLIKPNLVWDENYPTTSDSKTISKIINELQKVTWGAISVGDQGGKDMKGIYNYLNTGDAVFGAGANLVTFSEICYVGRYGWDLKLPHLEVYSEVYKKPVVINLCTLKRHLNAYLTCSLKNNFGAIVGPMATGSRGYLHQAPAFSISFLQRIAEVAGLINPELNIVDAREIMIDRGPLLEYGGIIKKDVDKIIISGDMVATDSYCAKLMEKYDPTFSSESIMPTLKRAEDIGLGVADLNKVKIIEVNMTDYNYFRFRKRPKKFLGKK